MRRPVVALLHHLARPFTGHAGAVLRRARIELDERRVAGGEPLPGIAPDPLPVLGVGIALDERRVAPFDPLPELDRVDGVLSLGGEQSVTAIGDDPALAAEAAFLRAAVARAVPVLGICLGGQLLAHALGGTVAPLPRRRLE